MYQPITRVTLAALVDLGYEVNMTAADPLILKNDTGYYASARSTDKGSNRLLKDRGVIVPSETFTIGSNIIRPAIIEI